MHKCTGSCLRRFFRRKVHVEQCRYGFPKKVSEFTTLNDINDTLKSRRKGHNRQKLYNLKRTEKEVYINDYNPYILLTWKGNVNLQFIGEQSMALDRYITNYITKGERNATNEIWDACNKTKSLRSQLKSFALKQLNGGTKNGGTN